MKKLIVVCALALAALGAASAPGASGGKTYAPKDCSKPSIAPKRIIFACGDAGAYINRLGWNKFGNHHARGRGVLKERKVCTPPQCPSNGFNRYSARIRLYKVKTEKCGGKRVRLFTRAELRFPGQSPPDADAFRHTQLYCNP
ncbi:hypothetical protein BH10ACT11_BH10ACT11_15390 [soil metagenome]